MIWEGYKNLIYFYHYYYFYTVCNSCSLSSWRAASVGAGTLRLVRACWITSGTSVTLQALFCHVGLQDVQLSFSCFVEKHICDFIPSLTMLDYKISNSLSVALCRGIIFICDFIPSLIMLDYMMSNSSSVSLITSWIGIYISLIFFFLLLWLTD